MVPVQSTGGRTTTNCINIGIKAFYANKLNSILKLKRKSIKCNCFYAIIIQFLNKNVRISTFKRFLKIKNITQEKLPLSNYSLILSARWIRVWEVECFCLNTNCKLYIRLLVSRNLCKQLYIILCQCLTIGISIDS